MRAGPLRGYRKRKEERSNVTFGPLGCAQSPLWEHDEMLTKGILICLLPLMLQSYTFFRKWTTKTDHLPPPPCLFLVFGAG